MARPSDIIVVGSGVIGCAIAHELARRGASVEVLDHRAVGMGATQASAGVLAPYLEAREEGPFLELARRSLALYDGFISRVAADSGIAIPYRRCGTLDVALDEAELRRMAADAAFFVRSGVPARVLDRAAVRAEEPLLGDEVAGGLLVDGHGYVAATELTRALATAARRHGAQLVESSRARRIAASGATDVIVETDRGPLTGHAVVLAAGSWSGGITIDGVTARAPVRPIRGQLLSLAWSGPTLRRITWSSRCYLVPWQDGTVLVGATVEDAGFDERTTAAGVRDLLDAACEIVPQAWNAGFNAARVGLRPATPDGLPIIGRSAAMPNLMYATGHYRNGILLAPVTARLVADALLDDVRDPVLDSLSPARFGAL